MHIFETRYLIVSLCMQHKDGGDSCFCAIKFFQKNEGWLHSNWILPLGSTTCFYRGCIYGVCYRISQCLLKLLHYSFEINLVFEIHRYVLVCNALKSIKYGFDFEIAIKRFYGDFKFQPGYDRFE